jgi:hypothetical protein
MNLGVAVTEAEWFACEKPAPMLTFLRGRVSDRKLRLFACACCRSIQRFIPVGACRDAIEVSSHFADGAASAEQLAKARTAAVAVSDNDRTRSSAAWAACETANPSAHQAALTAADWAADQLHRADPRYSQEERRVQAGFLRDIVGNPFRKFWVASLLRAARNSLIQEIAADIYEGGLQEDMNALADQLEQFGCHSEDVLRHCRCDELHVRGCWVLDRILGFEIEATAPPQPAKTVSERVQEIRRALSEYLGPKKYRRALRKAVAISPGSGLICCPREWDEFVLYHPEHKLELSELADVFAVCTVHGCELTQREVPAGREDPELLGDPNFLQARGTRFPHSHPEESEHGWHQLMWICPECQRLREEWVRSQP